VQGRAKVADLILDIVDIATKGRFGGQVAEALCVHIVQVADLILDIEDIATKGRFGG
jgi:hypothetical protein